MTNYLTSFKKEKMLICLLLCCLFYTNRSAAQNNYSNSHQQFYKTISFGEKINFGDIDESAAWTITNAKKNIYLTLRGSEINAYAFSEPGEYDITFHETIKHEGECNHAALPENFRIKAESVKMVFDFSKISFSENVVRGKSYSDLIVAVPVKISVKENTAAKLPAPGLSIAGIGVLMKAEPLEKEIILSNTTQLLKYKIKGTADRETYLMFDFYDFNNQAQTYNLPQIIK